MSLTIGNTISSKNTQSVASQSSSSNSSTPISQITTTAAKTTLVALMVTGLIAAGVWTCGAALALSTRSFTGFSLLIFGGGLTLSSLCPLAMASKNQMFSPNEHASRDVAHYLKETAPAIIYTTAGITAAGIGFTAIAITCPILLEVLLDLFL